jgi:glycosyltransferase involved in cell wall biosynthesis
MIYRNSDKILISSKGFRTSILEKGDFGDKLVYFPNWAEDVFTDAEKKQIPELPEGFRLMFAGNIGEAQDFDNVMKAALELKEEKDVKFLIIGDGRRKAWVEEYIRDNSLEETVHLLGRHPLDTMPSFYEQADAMFLALKDEPIFSLTAPAKIQTYMAAKKPVIAMINGETRNLIAESSCGLSCTSGDYMELASVIRSMKAMSAEEREHLGMNGFNYFNANFTKSKCMNHLTELLEQ